MGAKYWRMKYGVDGKVKARIVVSLKTLDPKVAAQRILGWSGRPTNSGISCAIQRGRTYYVRRISSKPTMRSARLFYACAALSSTSSAHWLMLLPLAWAAMLTAA